MNKLVLVVLKHLLFVLLTVSSQAAETSRILVWGDSLSAGYGIDINKGWVSLLQIKLGQAHFDYDVINGSISGETTTGGLRRLPQALNEHKPELVIIELGGNDGLRGYPVARIKENLAQLIDLCQRRDIKVLLTGIQIPPNYGIRYSKPFFDMYAQLAQQQKVALVPFLLAGIGDQPELMQSDGIHPVQTAQMSIVDNLWPYLQPLLKRNRADVKHSAL